LPVLRCLIVVRLKRFSSRRRWALRGAFALLAIALAATFGVPQQRGCGGGSTCAPLVEAPSDPTGSATPPTVIYLNRYGGTVRGGDDDAAHDSSSVVAGRDRERVDIPGAPLDDATWAEVVACVRAQFARFNVQIVDARPSEPGYVMVLFGGTGDELGLPADVRGKAPLDSDGCRTVRNAVVFVFSDKLGAAAQPHCEVAAHELAHVFSVDHELLAADTASYLPFGGAKWFQDVDALCGEQQERPCICGRASQNAVQILLQKLGPSAIVDTPPPTVSVSAARERTGYVFATVQATDPMGISNVTLTYEDGRAFVSSTCGDGQLPCLATGSTYTFTVASATGMARYTATAINEVGAVAVTAAQELVVDGAPPDPSPITLAVDTRASSGGVTAHATASSTAGAIASTTLYWTDARGITTSRPLCSSGTNEWSLLVQRSSDPGERSFVVGATDTAGHTAFSRRTRVAIE
jgi:hypothetical protein